MLGDITNLAQRLLHYFDTQERDKLTALTQHYRFYHHQSNSVSSRSGHSKLRTSMGLEPGTASFA